MEPLKKRLGKKLDFKISKTSQMLNSSFCPRCRLMKPRRGDMNQPRVSALTFIYKSISAAKLPYCEAVRDHSPGLLGLGFWHKEFALKGRPNADGLSTWIARYSFSPAIGRPFRADFDVPGLKAWAVLLNRFAVRALAAPEDKKSKFVQSSRS